MKTRFVLATLFVSTLIPLSAFADATSTPDTTPPVLTVPVDQTFSATTFPASPVLVAATATDDTDPAPVVTHSPTSFAHGTTTVTWVATDAAGNAATTSSQVGVFLNVDTSADVPATCSATDTDAVIHTYPEATSSTSYLAICALEATLSSGAVTDAQLSNQFPSLGLFITTINGVAADPSSQYWALYQNGSFANFGLTQLPIAAGDTIMLQLHDFSDNNLGDSLTMHVGTLVGTTTTPTAPTSTPSQGGGGQQTVHFQLNVPAALAYIASKQSADGSFGSSLFTDWAALAFAAQDSGTASANLRAYLTANTPVSTIVTDNERHAMALMALGINPYTGTSKDYIKPIADAFDGTQIGDAHLDNDDIFALFPLTHAGYNANDDIIKKTVAFILSAQTSIGSWDGSIDMTAAAIQALSPLASLPDVPVALTNAESYLRSQQQANGGFGSSFSTSWALQAIAALGESPSNWAPSGQNPQDYLVSLQQADGGVESLASDVNTRIWATEYAIPASLSKTWDSLLFTFSRPTNNSGSATTETATSSATSTSPTATSTPAVATSTPEITATSTPALSEVSLTNPATTTTPVKITLKKEIVQKKRLPVTDVPAPTTTTSAPESQTAAAESVDGGILSAFWKGFKGFIGLFRRLF